VARDGITNEQWALVGHHFIKSPGLVGRPPAEPRRCLNGILWILSTGAPWRDLPSEFGSWSTVYKNFARWRDGGVFRAVVEELQRHLLEFEQLRTDLWCVDGTIIRAHRVAAGGGKKGES
jgi:transposase